MHGFQETPSLRYLAVPAEILDLSYCCISKGQCKRLVNELALDSSFEMGNM
jgi:hypothetical protein